MFRRHSKWEGLPRRGNISFKDPVWGRAWAACRNEQMLGLPQYRTFLYVIYVVIFTSISRSAGSG